MLLGMVLSSTFAGGGSMQLHTSELEKLDAGLLDILQRDFLRGTARFPVIITCQDVSQLTELATVVERLDGSLRHEHAMLVALSAWVPVSSLSQLVGYDYVVEVELDSSSEIAIC